MARTFNDLIPEHKKCKIMERLRKINKVKARKIGTFNAILQSDEFKHFQYDYCEVMNNLEKAMRNDKRFAESERLLEEQYEFNRSLLIENWITLHFEECAEKELERIELKRS